MGFIYTAVSLLSLVTSDGLVFRRRITMLTVLRLMLIVFPPPVGVVA